MFSRSFWKSALERALKTGAQAAALVWTGSDSGPGNLFELDFEVIAGAVGFGIGYSLLTSIASGLVPSGPTDSPSLVDT